MEFNYIEFNNIDMDYIEEHKLCQGFKAKGCQRNSKTQAPFGISISNNMPENLFLPLGEYKRIREPFTFVKLPFE